MECQVEKNEHFQHFLLYEFNRGSKAAEATRNICAVYEENSIAERTAQKWLVHFKQGNFEMGDNLLCNWWDMEGIFHYELPERNLTINAER
jgi:hypothetical protein